MKKLWVLFLLVVCLPAPAISAGNIRVGPVEVHPFISVMETYDDNVFATANDTKSDWITTTTPGIQLLMPFRTHKFSAEYRAVINNYIDYTSEDTVDHHAAAAAEFSFASRYGLKLRNVYTKGHVSRNSSAIGEVEKFDRNDATGAVSYKFADRVEGQVEYTRTYLHYDKDYDSFRNRNEDLIATSLFYRFLPKTSVFAEFDFHNFDYTDQINGNNLNNKVYSPLIGLRWDMTERTTGTVKGGYLQKEFADPSKKDISTWSAFADLTHAFSERASIKIFALRDVNESNLQGTNYYVTTEGYAAFTYKLLYNVSAIARASYGEDDYTNTAALQNRVERYDKRALGGVGLRYQMRSWLEFALDYNHLNRDSNIDANDMTENTASLSVNLAL